MMPFSLNASLVMSPPPMIALLPTSATTRPLLRSRIRTFPPPVSTSKYEGHTGTRPLSGPSPGNVIPRQRSSSLSLPPIADGTAIGPPVARSWGKKTSGAAEEAPVDLASPVLALGDGVLADNIAGMIAFPKSLTSGRSP
jgi:hypothetical protein